MLIDGSNVLVADRAVQVWPCITAFAAKILNKEFVRPKAHSFEFIEGCVKDALVVAKLLIFIAIAKIVQQFRTVYQCDKPMTPFLYQDLPKITKSLLQKFVKSEVVAETFSSGKFCKLDIMDPTNHVELSNIDVGFAANEELIKLKRSKKVSNLQSLQIKSECKSFVLKLKEKIREKCPLKYILLKYLTSLDPKKMAEEKDFCRKNFDELLREMIKANRITGGPSACDEIRSQFHDFIDCAVPKKLSAFSNFNHLNASSRVDVVMYKEMGQKLEYQRLCGVVQEMLLLSHGQATVERGFSVERQVKRHNLTEEESIVSQRLICDYVRSTGGVANVEITKELFDLC